MSNKCDEQFTSAIGLGELLEKPEGEDLQADQPMESYTIVCKNRSWGRLVRFSYETVKDTKAVQNILADTVGTWGQKLPVTKEKFYAKYFNQGAMSAGNDVFNGTITGVVTDSSGDKIYDSKAWFATDHADKVGGSYANYTASRALSADNLRTTYETYTITNNRDERGDIIELMPDTLLIPPALRFTSQEILNTTLIPFSMDNTINVLATIVEPLDWAYLTDTDGWFLGKRRMGLMATDREDVSLDFWQDETSLDYFARIFTRFGGCITNWRSNLGFPTLRNVVNNRVNSGKLLTKTRTILSQAWKEISLKVQRLVHDSKQTKLWKVIEPRVPCSLT